MNDNSENLRKMLVPDLPGQNIADERKHWVSGKKLVSKSGIAHQVVARVICNNFFFPHSTLMPMNTLEDSSILSGS